MRSRSPRLLHAALFSCVSLALVALTTPALADIPPQEPGCKCSAPGASTGVAWPALFGVAAGALVLGLRKRETTRT